MTWAARHPHPGTSPKKPEDLPPARAQDYEAWWQDRERWNSYVLAVRRHDLARFVDASLEREARFSIMEERDLVLRTIAVMVLDGSIPTSFVVPAGLWKI